LSVGEARGKYDTDAYAPGHLHRPWTAARIATGRWFWLKNLGPSLTWGSCPCAL